MILEGIVTSVNDLGDINVAPMGPIVDESMNTLQLRPFKTSQTFQNLKQHACGVFHVVDDVLLLARAAIDRLEATPPTCPAREIRGAVLQDACRWYEFQVDSFDEDDDRTRLEAHVVHSGRIRDFFGFNRAKHAVVEAAILATRLDFLPQHQIQQQFQLLRTTVEKTAGPRELEAFELLERFIGDSL